VIGLAGRSLSRFICHLSLLAIIPCERDTHLLWTYIHHLLYNISFCASSASLLPSARTGGEPGYPTVTIAVDRTDHNLLFQQDTSNVSALRRHSTMSPTTPAEAMHTVPIANRPRHGSWWNTIMFPLLFNVGILGLSFAQMCALPLLLVPFVGRRMFEGVIDWSKDGFGRLCESTEQSVTQAGERGRAVLASRNRSALLCC
jgi:hypothetical protein